MNPTHLCELTSDVLTSRLDQLLRQERGCLVDFLWHLAELERRKTHVELGFGSLFDYCRSHNQHHAREDFGEDHMALFTSR